MSASPSHSTLLPAQLQLPTAAPNRLGMLAGILPACHIVDWWCLATGGLAYAKGTCWLAGYQHCLLRLCPCCDAAPGGSASPPFNPSPPRPCCSPDFQSVFRSFTSMTRHDVLFTLVVGGVCLGGAALLDPFLSSFWERQNEGVRCMRA